MLAKPFTVEAMRNALLEGKARRGEDGGVLRKLQPIFGM